MTTAAQTIDEAQARPLAAIHPDTRLGVVALHVADLARSLRFYRDVIGLQSLSQDAAAATLGAGGAPLLELRALAGARPVPHRATGLYHVAILLPTAADLGRALQRMLVAGVPVGQGDHLVSEALYLSDPDGNGIEVYRDRPRSTWEWRSGQVQMATDPVDLEALLRAAERENAALEAPAGTTIGHVHLKVADLAAARAFFADMLGFDVVAQMPGALFVSAGGYHHHFGLNTWHSRGAAPAPAGTAGLISYTIVVPESAELARVATRLDAAAIAYSRAADRLTLTDPWSNTLVLAVEPA